MLLLEKGPLLFVLILILGPSFVFGAEEVGFLNKESVLSWFLPSSDHMNPCYKDLLEVVLGLFRQEEWALKMLDAVGKPEAGILGGNYGWVGSYEQCIGIKKGDIEGQHCWWGMNAKLIGICLPNSCKNKDFNGSLAIDCEYQHIEINMTSLVAIFISCILLFFVVLGTSADLLNGKTRDKKVDRNGKSKGVESNNCASFTPVVLYFSLYSNGKKLFALDNARSDVTFGQLNGLKVIATVMVILVHTFQLSETITKNPVELNAQYGRWFLQPFLQTYPVELFFFVTGFLTLNGIVRKPLIKNKPRFIFTYVLHRYFKMLVAPLTIVLVANVAIKPHLSSGPFWNLSDQTCSNPWWKMVLFVTNFRLLDRTQCFPIWWFLSVSMQLHLMSLFIIIPLIYKKYRLSILSGSGLLVYSWSWLARKVHHSALLPLYPEGNDSREVMTYMNERGPFYQVIYFSRIYHLGPYLVGMALAWVLFKHKLSLTKIKIYVSWTLSFIGLFLVFYGIYLRPNRMLRSVHGVFGATVYSLSLAWMVFICDTKNNGVVSRVLRWKYWLPLSKLSLTTFLLHPMVIEYYTYSQYDKVTYSLALLVVFFVRHWVVTYLVAVVVALSIETPLNAIVDSLFR